MKPRSDTYRAFRMIFILLVGATLLLLAWQWAQRPPAPSRVAWPPPAPAKPSSPPRPRVMKTPVQPPASYVFDFPSLDAVVEVTPSAEGVVICASRDCFSEERKLCFIRELAAEGFIDESNRWRPSGSIGGVRWIVDATEFMPGAVSFAQTRRVMLRLIVSASGLWLCMMGFLLLHAAR